MSTKKNKTIPKKKERGSVVFMRIMIVVIVILMTVATIASFA